jgi:hypothetical protein
MYGGGHGKSAEMGYLVGQTQIGAYHITLRILRDVDFMLGAKCELKLFDPLEFLVILLDHRVNITHGGRLR